MRFQRNAEALAKALVQSVGSAAQNPTADTRKGDATTGDQQHRSIGLARCAQALGDEAEPQRHERVGQGPNNSCAQ